MKIELDFFEEILRYVLELQTALPQSSADFAFIGFRKITIQKIKMLIFRGRMTIYIYRYKRRSLCECIL